MGVLLHFKQYLDGRARVLSDLEDRLCRLQSKYENFFSEISKVRESEMAQLTEHILSDRSQLPEWFNQKLDATQVEVEQAFAEQLGELKAQHAKILETAEKTRQHSLKSEKKIKRDNRLLDDEEEQLKLRNDKLLKRIAGYNKRIKSLNKGFGFFSNFFKMKQLAVEKKALDEEQADIAARIESLRLRWQQASSSYQESENDRQARWVETETEAAALSAKIQALGLAQPEMVVRTTIERVLDQQERKTLDPGENDPACPRCKMPNHAGNHFCHICARRLGDDRPDFDGSLEEVSEANRHFQRFSDGMMACQEIIGLVRGLLSGIEAFTKSVKEMQASEIKYPLPILEINVPKPSLDYGANFDRLDKALDRNLSLHPKLFASQVNMMIHNVFTEKKIMNYFERMGEELSRQAEAQWRGDEA